ncbi:MAG: NHL repeat-containing protein, partial [Spirochaetota bacterium]
SVARITTVVGPFLIQTDSGNGDVEAGPTEGREVRAMLKSEFENFRYEREAAQAQSAPEQPADQPAFEPIPLSDEYDGTELSDPEGFVIGTDGNLFIVDTGNNRVVKLNADREFVAAVGFQGSGPDEFQTPVDVTIFQDQVVVVDRGNHRLSILDQDLNPQQIAGSRGTGTPGRFTTPTKAVSYRGRLYVLDSGNDRVQVFDEDFEPTDVEFPITDAQDTTTSFTIVPRQYLIVLDYAGGQALYYDIDSPGPPIRTEALPDEIAGRQISDVTFVNLEGTGALAYTLDREHQVAVTDAETQELISMIGRRGTGAGTFNQPIQVRSEADSLIVLERRNRRLQVIRELP